MFWGLTDNTIISEYPSGYNTKIELDDNYIFITNPVAMNPYEESGFSIYNITNPISMEYVSYFETMGTPTLNILGSYVYCMENGGLEIIDISDINNPIHSGFGTLTTFSPYYPFTVAGDYLYGGSFSIVDVSDSSAPIERSTLDIGEISGISIVNNTAYLVNETGLFIVNISDPDNPLKVKHHINISSVENRKIVVTNNIAYITGWSSGLVGIVDVSNINEPIEIGVISNISQYFEPISMELWDNTIYISSWDRNSENDSSFGKLLVFNVENSGQLILEKEIGSYGSIRDIELSEQYMYLETDTPVGHQLLITVRP